METHEIEIVIGTQGDIELRVKGMQGMGCLVTTEALEQMLGEVTFREMAPSAYQVEAHLDQENRA